MKPITTTFDSYELETILDALRGDYDDPFIVLNALVMVGNKLGLKWDIDEGGEGE